MKTVTWQDTKGWLHKSLIRDTDPDTAAPQGIPQDPPDINKLDWEAIKRDLHNELVNRQLLTQADLQGELGSVSLILVSHLRLLYRQAKEE
jgi:hypothetical protein